MYKVCLKLLCNNAIVFIFLFSLVSPPAVTVTVSPEAVDPIYTSTAINLTCTAVLSEDVDTATTATATWTGPTSNSSVFGQQPTDLDRISVRPAVSMGERMFESILILYPTDFEEDSGLHTCQMTVSSNTMLMLQDSLIVSSASSGNRTIEVEG